jgi:chromate reductase
MHGTPSTLPTRGERTLRNRPSGGEFAQTFLGFLDLVEASKHYPCIKCAWVELLGEHPSPAIDRVE